MNTNNFQKISIALAFSISVLMISSLMVSCVGGRIAENEDTPIKPYAENPFYWQYKVQSREKQKAAIVKIKIKQGRSYCKNRMLTLTEACCQRKHSFLSSHKLHEQLHISVFSIHLYLLLLASVLKKEK